MVVTRRQLRGMFRTAKGFGKTLAGSIVTRLGKKAVNYGASKVTSVLSGSRKRKRPLKKVVSANKKVNKKIRKAVAAELGKDVPTGTYRKLYTGSLAANNNSTGLDVYRVCLERGGGNVSPHTVFAMQVTPFITKRVWDAASVLFNNKTAAINLEASTGNFNAAKTKIHLKYASYELELRNLTDMDQDVVIYEFTAKDNTDVDPATVIDNNKGNALFKTAPTVQLTGSSFAISEGYTFGMFPGLSEHWDMKKSTKSMRRGESYKLFRSIRNQHYDLKALLTDSGDVASYAKGQKIYYFGVNPIMAGVAQTTSSKIDGVVRYGESSNNKTIVAAVKEVYVVQQPSNTVDAQEGDVKVVFVDRPRKIPATSVQYYDRGTVNVSTNPSV